jgi:arabinan endo-1,5-alpha-L-arabinosidase
MSKITLTLALLTLVSLCSAPAPAAEGVLEGMPDPAVIQGEDGRFYIFATGQGLPIYRSDDLVKWELIDRVFDTPVPAWSKEAIPPTEGIWAPDIVKFKDKYYVYYCVSSFGSQRSVIGVAVNKTLDPASSDYKWTDSGMVLESFPGKDDFNAIDLAAMQDKDGTAYAVWGSHWGGIKFAAINPDTGKFLEEKPVIASVAARPDTSSRAIEGAYLVQKLGWYYLFVSFDSCCSGAESTYKVMVGRSKKIEGPYVDFNDKPMTQGGGTLVLANNDNWRGPGHNSVLQAKQGDFIVHHTYDTCRLDKQRILQIRPIYWTDDQWPIVGEPISEKNPVVAEPVKFTAKALEGSWRMSNDYGRETIVDLIPRGRIANQRRATWAVSGSTLMLTWPGEADAQSTWVDRCVIEPSGKSFIGRNQTGAVIRGTKICP